MTSPDKIEPIEPIEIIDLPADVEVAPVQPPVCKLVTDKVCMLFSKIMLYISSYSRRSIILTAQFIFIIAILIIMAIYLRVFIKTYEHIDIHTSTTGNVYPCFYVVRNVSTDADTDICVDSYTFINTTDVEDDDYMCNNLYYRDVIGYCIYNNPICESAQICDCLEKYENYDITSGFTDHFIIYSFYYLVIAIIIISCIFVAFLYMYREKLFSIVGKKSMSVSECILTINFIGCVTVICSILLLFIICIWLPIATTITKPNNYCDIVCNNCYWVDAPINAFIINQCCSASYYGLEQLNFDSTAYSTNTYLYYCISATFIPIAITFAIFFSKVLYVPDFIIFIINDGYFSIVASMTNFNNN